jgi:hypothetical protein
MDQRLCRATFALGPGGLAVTAPASSSICPPGYYMLFLVNGAGVPSVAKMIRIDTNTAPTANAGTNQTVEANASTGTFVTLNGTGSTDLENNIATYQWSEGPTTIATGAQPSVALSVGVHTLTLRVTDSLGMFGESTVTVTITDATAPVISLLTASPVVLRPANGTMTPVTVAATVSDNGDPSPVTKILSVTSTEANPAPSDVQITGNLTVNLRAERFSIVRRYTILVECRDASNNASTRTVTVDVRSKWFP